MKKSTTIRLLKLMKKWLYLYIPCVILLGGLELMMQIILSSMFKEIFDAIEVSNFARLINSVKWAFIFILGAIIASPIVKYLESRAIISTMAHIRKNTFDHVQRLPIHSLKAGHSGDLISRLTNDISQIEIFFKEILHQSASAFIRAMGAAIFMFVLDWRLALVSLVTSFAVVRLNVAYAHKLKALSSDIQGRLGGLTAKMSDILAGCHVIKAFNLQRNIMEEFDKANQEICQQGIKKVKANAVLSIATYFSFMGGFMMLITVGSFLALRGLTTIGIIVACVQLQNNIGALFNNLGNFNTRFQTALASAERVFDITDRDKEPLTYPILSAENKNSIISFKEVAFGYSTGERVLDNLSFEVKKGQMVALAGESGGGKSTIFKLILGFYRPLEGRISIDGKALGDQRLEELRDKIAYVSQDAYLFFGTIRENIGYGKDNAIEDEIIEAAKAANAHDFIMSLEKGYDTVVGERGTHLSGGQRQRIAIARALLKNAPILLLDEATSALDNESEYLVQKALNKLMLGKTTLVIAHRLSTIQRADKILVIKDGVIAEEGTHQQLITNTYSTYSQLYHKQIQQQTA